MDPSKSQSTSEYWCRPRPLFVHVNSDNDSDSDDSDDDNDSDDDSDDSDNNNSDNDSGRNNSTKQQNIRNHYINGTKYRVQHEAIKCNGYLTVT
jgi:hypothetical protein